MSIKDLNTESVLLQRLRDGDPTALEHIYEQYWEPLLFTAFNILKDKAACEDILQDIFTRLWKNRQTLNVTISLRAYLYASCRYAVLRYIRTQKVRDQVFDNLEKQLNTPSSFGQLEYKELLNAIENIVHQLPEKCREVYLLSRQGNLSHREIAERLAISTKTVERHITRALADIRSGLGHLFTIECILWLIS